MAALTVIMIISPGAAQREKPRETLCAAGRSGDGQSWGRDGLGTAQEHGEGERLGKEAKPAALYEKSWKGMSWAAHGTGAALGDGDGSCPGGSPRVGGGSTYTMSLSSSRVSGGGLIRT